VIGEIDVEAGWECTSCQACTEACPVGNEVEKSDEIRNIQVLVEGKVPQEYQKLFMNLQTTGNTEGASTSILSEKLPIYDGSQEYVLWLGCFAKYALDPKYGDSVLNLSKILDRANITYGILANEKCTGEPANKLGDKLTYNMLMRENLENLKNIKKIITMCPHCSVNLGIEYKKYEKVEYQVYHHTQVIESLINNKKIKVNQSNHDKITFHDPCNLSRSMSEVDAPRTAIKASCSNFNELKENGKNTLCCGAGGGLWWKKETQGRAHLVRAEQVIESGCDTVVTGCSFCYGMMNQGLAPLTPQDQETITVKDIADLVAASLD
jgi:Fe-S oxidoreductase